MLNIALFGPPGAGKGTQSKLLIENYNLIYIATGDILRAEIAEKTELGLEAKHIIEKGGLVSDEIIVQIIEKKIKMHPESSGFLFDGFPRTLVQAYILEGLLLRVHSSLTSLISLEVPKEESVKRLLKRAEIENRKDDTKEIIQNRLKEYDNKTVPVISFYKEKNNYIGIDGTGKIEDVFSEVQESIEIALRKVLLNVVIFGYPGAGRGTQAQILAEKYNLTYLSTGDMLQEEIKKASSLGKRVERLMEKGALVPDEIVIKLIEKRIEMNPDTNGFIFKGFPRTMVQAYILDGLLLKINSSISCIFNINVPHLELVKRLALRGKTENRMEYDSNTETIVERLQEHEKKTQPILKYYKKQSPVIDIDGLGKKDEIFQSLIKEVEKVIKKVR
ncbi:MAG: adenylate kinase [Bacteroidota bacterium]|nr:adenylate kinase [Bacteroidota bacterium]